MKFFDQLFESSSHFEMILLLLLTFVRPLRLIFVCDIIHTEQQQEFRVPPTQSQKRHRGFQFYLKKIYFHSMILSSENDSATYLHTDETLTVVSVDSSSRHPQPCAAASLCSGRVPECSLAPASDASPAQPARAPTQTPVNQRSKFYCVHYFEHFPASKSSSLMSTSRYGWYMCNENDITPDVKLLLVTGMDVSYLRRFPSRFIFKFDKFVL